jgi:DNA-binding transcriptional ArsR family regulator
MRLLGQLFLQPDVEYTVAELESATSIPQQTISRELARLVQAGLVRDRRQGRMHFVAANQASLYFPELARLLLKALGPKEVLADEFAGVPGINEAYIFGSWARRYDGLLGDPPRDVDVVVIGDPDVDTVYAACQRAARTISQEVNPVVLTQKEWKQKRSGFLRQLEKGSLVQVVPRS